MDVQIVTGEPVHCACARDWAKPATDAQHLKSVSPPPILWRMVAQYTFPHDPLRCLLVGLLGIFMALPGHAATVAATASATSSAASLPPPASVNEIAPPVIHNFDTADYNGSPQNWSIVQGHDGVIYAGNVEDGVLSFDGARWRRVPVPARLTVRSLAVAADGRIYVGIVGDFGYLKPNADGQLAFTSLLNLVPADERDFTDVWNIHINQDGVYFSTLTRIFHLQDNRLSIIKPQTSFHVSFLVDGTVYIREVDRGLMKVVGDHLVPVPGGEHFADDRVYALLPWHGVGAHPGELLVGTRNQGWFLLDGGKAIPWPTTVDAELRDAAIYNAIWLADGRLAIATLRGGLFLLDAQGHLLQHLTRTNGLNTNVILALCQDRQHGLWLATGDGVTRLDTDSPLTHFGERTGLQGDVLDIARYAGTLYVGTTEGLFRLTDGGAGNPRFEQLPKVLGQNWSLLPFMDQLLVAGNDGVFVVNRDGSSRQLLENLRTTHVTAAQSLLRSQRDPLRVFIGYQDGIGSIRWQDNQWINEGRIPKAQEEARTLAQDTDGSLWLGLWVGGIAHLKLPADWQGPRDQRRPVMEHFGTADGLPEGSVDAVQVDGQIRFITAKGIYRFAPATRRFAPDPAFATLFPDGTRQVSMLHQDRHGTLWMYASNPRTGVKETGRALRVNGHWRWQVTPLQAIAGNGMSAFHEDPNGIVWLGGDKGLYRYDTTQSVQLDAGFNGLIREVTTRNGRVLFTSGSNATMPDIPYGHNALRFEFAAPSYDDFAANRYQVQLQGLDSEWSPWSDAPYRDYTNLHEGDYRFRVRTRNVYGEEGKEASFAFRILPP